MQEQVIVQQQRKLIQQLLEIYDLKKIAEVLSRVSQCEWTRDSLKHWSHCQTQSRLLTTAEMGILHTLLPQPSPHHPHYKFRFIDLFAGIGGIRKGFETIGGCCVFTSEWNKYALRTYKANWYNVSTAHKFNTDIREITCSAQTDISDETAREYIEGGIPDHDVLLAGFPCQPFSLAGVSKKNALGRAHGFDCDIQGTLFFDVARIIATKKPAIFVLENVKHLKSHDKGKTFRIITEALDELGYAVADVDNKDKDDPKIIDARHFLPQHRERIVLVGLRRDFNLHHGFTLRDIKRYFPARVPTFNELLEPVVDEKYLLTPQLWRYLYFYAKKHQAKGNGFGYGLIDPKDSNSMARTLSARYHKDGSEILIDRGWDKVTGEVDFNDAQNQMRRPRRLTPRECARLMGFEAPGGDSFRIPVSDTQAYRQFGNSVVVPVFSALAQLLLPLIEQAIAIKATQKR